MENTPVIPSAPDVDRAAQKEKLDRYVRFLEMDPANHNLVLDALALAISIGEIEVAEKIVTSVENSFSDDPVFTAHAGYLFMLKQDFDRSLEFYGMALAAGNREPVIFFNMATCYLYLKEYQLSLDTLNADSAVKAQLPAEYLLLSARLLHHLDDMKGAIRDLKTLLQDCGWNPEAAGLLSLILFEAGLEPQYALKLANDSLHDNPTLLEALLARISLNLENGEFVQALTDGETATQFHPTSGRAWASLSQVHFNNFHFELAKTAAQSAVKFMNNHIGTWHILAWAHIMLGEFDDALWAFKESYKLDDRFAETHGGLAAVYAHQNQLHLANKHLKIAQKLNPDGFAAVYAKFMIMKANKQDTEAANYFEQSTQVFNAQIGSTPKKLMDKRLAQLLGGQQVSKKLH